MTRFSALPSRAANTRETAADTAIVAARGVMVRSYALAATPGWWVRSPELTFAAEDGVGEGEGEHEAGARATRAGRSSLRLRDADRRRAQHASAGAAGPARELPHRRHAQRLVEPVPRPA